MKSSWSEKSENSQGETY